eukprot:CAMPEP_0116961206 /NCGR_PEP_ID=MMETSP0467-20121206/46425_1 /TAXON_ID=283647 /ORGANISM="Mesodinium pulex, Strain SPMC105" /LENGTH=57 /DNA_ID=CAMNT_0004649095 /DNA_START=53 /DNA_END=226 /DNA_ORIENTATION=-
MAAVGAVHAGQDSSFFDRMKVMFCCADRDKAVPACSQDALGATDAAAVQAVDSPTSG